MVQVKAVCHLARLRLMALFYLQTCLWTGSPMHETILWSLFPLHFLFLPLLDEGLYAVLDHSSGLEGVAEDLSSYELVMDYG